MSRKPRDALLCLLFGVVLGATFYLYVDTVRFAFANFDETRAWLLTAAMTLACAVGYSVCFQTARRWWR